MFLNIFQKNIVSCELTAIAYYSFFFFFFFTSLSHFCLNALAVKLF